MSEPFLGEIKTVGFNFAPRGWALCDGQLLPISQYTALFSLLGTTYGGDGRTTFGLPELRGRAPIHVGTGPGLTPRRWGEKGGSETNIISASQMPSHSHAGTVQSTLKASSAAGEETAPAAGGALASGVQIYNEETPNVSLSPDGIDSTVTIANAGGGQAVNNMQPYLAIYFIIALQGIFPSRS